VLAQVGSSLGIDVIEVDVDQMKQGKHKQWAPLFQGGGIPYTVMLDSKDKTLKTWVGGYDANTFTREVKANMK